MAETDAQHAAVEKQSLSNRVLLYLDQPNCQLAKDGEETIISAEALLYAASIILLLRRLAR